MDFLMLEKIIFPKQNEIRKEITKFVANVRLGCKSEFKDYED